jgi:hypothetical protein
MLEEVLMLSRLMGAPAAVGCLLTVLSTACDATRPSMPGTPTAPPAPRAGKLADRTVHYRHDLAFAEDPTILRNPHNFIVSPTSANALVWSIAQGAQRQIAAFFASDGTVVIQQEPGRFFKVPFVGRSPEA